MKKIIVGMFLLTSMSCFADAAGVTCGEGKTLAEATQSLNSTLSFMKYGKVTIYTAHAILNKEKFYDLEAVKKVSAPSISIYQVSEGEGREKKTVNKFIACVTVDNINL